MSTNNQSNANPDVAILPGTKAPDFTLHDTPDQTVSLSELRGRPVGSLSFIPLIGAPVCGRNFALQ